MCGLVKRLLVDLMGVTKVCLRGSCEGLCELAPHSSSECLLPIRDTCMVIVVCASAPWQLFSDNNESSGVV